LSRWRSRKGINQGLEQNQVLHSSGEEEEEEEEKKIGRRKKRREVEVRRDAAKH